MAKACSRGHAVLCRRLAGHSSFDVYVTVVAMVKRSVERASFTSAQASSIVESHNELIAADLRLCRFFGRSNGYWLRAQAAYDTEVAAKALRPVLRRIKPWVRTAA